MLTLIKCLTNASEIDSIQWHGGCIYSLNHWNEKSVTLMKMQEIHAIHVKALTFQRNVLHNILRLDLVLLVFDRHYVACRLPATRLNKGRQGGPCHSQRLNIQ